MALVSTYTNYSSVGNYGIAAGTYGSGNRMFTQINITPLVDVLLVLVVVMILIAPGNDYSVIKVDPPQQCSCSCLWHQTHKVEVSISKSGAITFNGKPVSADSLSIERALQKEQLALGTTDILLNVSSDGDALHKHVVCVMDAAEGAGIKNMRMLPFRN